MAGDPNNAASRPCAALALRRLAAIGKGADRRAVLRLTGVIGLATSPA